MSAPAWLVFLAGAGALAFAGCGVGALCMWLQHRREAQAQRARDARAFTALVNLSLPGARRPVTEADVQALLKQAEEGK